MRALTADDESRPGAEESRQPGWRQTPQFQLGSGGLAARLRDSIKALECMGVEVPSPCRCRNAVAFLEGLNNDPVLIRLGDPVFERALEAHDRTARELFLITYMAWEDRRHNPRTPFTNTKLTACLFGADVNDGRDAEPRNTQFELFVAATMRLGGAGVYRGEADLICDVASQRVAVAAKRIRSERDDTLDDRLDEAAEQIARSGRPGFVALNVDGRFRGIDPRATQEDVRRMLGTAFDSIPYRRLSTRQEVLGVLIFGFAAVATPASGGGLPQYSIVSPVRWEVWCPNFDSAARFEAYFAAWHERLQRNTAFLMSPEFGSRPL